MLIHFVELNEWLTATLSILTMALTILGVLIALVAIWGYRGIKDEAKAIAESVAKKKLGEYLDSSDIQDRLKEEVRRRVGLEADQLFSDLSMAGAYARIPGDAPEPVADKYPGPESDA